MGPLQALLGHLIFPFIWRVLETLMTAKMARMFPNNSGYVGWIFVGFDPFWGFQLGRCKWLMGILGNYPYQVLLLDYLKSIVPILGSKFPRIIVIPEIIVALTYMNYRDLMVA